MPQLRKIDVSRIENLTEKDWDRAAKLAIDTLNEVALASGEGEVRDINQSISETILPQVKIRMREDGAAFEYLCDFYTGDIEKNASNSNYTAFGATVAGGALIGALIFPPLGIGIAAGGLVALIASRNSSGWQELERLKDQALANRQSTVLEIAAFTSPQPLYQGRERNGKDMANIYIRMGKTLDLYRSALKLSQDLNIWNQLKSVFVAVFNFIVDIIKGLAEVVRGVVKFVAGVASSLTWIPWVLGGAAMLFFVVPPVIKLIRAKRRGGTDALLEESEKLLESGKENIKSGAKKGALFAKNAAKAYATKNPAAVLSGVRRRNVRNSRLSRRKAAH